MRKIPTLFRRDPDDRRFVLPEVEPRCEWVIAGEGTSTRKYDGTCVLYAPELDPTLRPAAHGALDGWWTRREVKADGPRPEHYVVVETDPNTGKTVGWEPAEGSSFARYLAEAVTTSTTNPPEPGTYELIGPRVNRNPEKAGAHALIRHALADVVDAPRDFEGLGRWLHAHPYEGVVWHHPDGRMVKIKRRDFPRG